MVETKSRKLTANLHLNNPLDSVMAKPPIYITITVKPSDIVILQLIVTTFFPESAIFTPLKIMFFSFSWVERIPFL